MPPLKRLVIAVLVAAVALAPNAHAGPQPQAAPAVDYWTEPSSTNIFRDSLPSRESGHTIQLDSAVNEEESAQIVVRSADAFTVDGVTFENLTSGTKVLKADNLSYNFVTYQQFDHNTLSMGRLPIYPVVREAPGDFPDPLSNARTMQVAERSTQSIWITVAVPKGTGAGVYRGTVKVATSNGELVVPLAVDVRDVVVPDPKDQVFETSLWNSFFGEMSWKPDGDTILAGYDYPRSDPRYQQVLEDLARQMKRHRTNTLTVPLVGLLLEADGTSIDGDGRITFDWSKLDELVQFFVDRGVVKRLEGFWVSATTDNWEGAINDVRDVEIIDGSGQAVRRNYVDYTSPKARNFIGQFIPALKQHVEEKGWDQSLKYWMHVGDEPGGDKGEEEKAWNDILDLMQQYWPNVRVGDAAFHEPVAGRVSQRMSVVIPNLLNYEWDQELYDGLRADGRDLYFYNCNIPAENYLNRFIDQPQFNQRLTSWYAYARGANGYLHYSMNGWIADVQGEDEKGDHSIVWPDKENNRIESSIRYESLRDGIEDYEVLNILGQKNLPLAKDLANALTERADKYSPDTGYQARIRRLALDAAAGKEISPDLARGATATASSAKTGYEPAKAVDGDPATSWQPAKTGAASLTLDLGRQVQLDGVRLKWSGAPASSYTVKISYDGKRWSPAYTGGGGTFAGINGKTRRIKIEFPNGVSGVSGVEVAGAVLAKENVLGGLTYDVSPTPGELPDSGIESTDGVLADAHDDGRTYGFTPGQEPATVRFDLGANKQLGSVRIHAYEEYPAYRPDVVTVETSEDGVHWVQKGFLPGTPNDQSRIWYEFDFPQVSARYLRVTFENTEDEAMLIDEIEAYESRDHNLAEGASYRHDEDEPAGGYPDTGTRESTDGVIAGHHDDGFSYGYNLTDDDPRTVKVLVDLGSSQPIGRVEVHDNFDGVTKYGPDTVRILAGDSPSSLTQVGRTSVSSAQWFRLPVQARARYVQVEYEKRSQGERGDWIFVDEIAVYPS